MPVITQRNKRTGETRQIDTDTGEVVPQSAPATAEQPSAFMRFLSNASSSLMAPLTGAKNLIMHPLASAEEYARYKQEHPIESAFSDNPLGYLSGGRGPLEAGKQIASGDVAGGVGSAVGQIAAASLPETLPAAVRGTGTLARKVGQGLEAAGEMTGPHSRWVAGASVLHGNVPAAATAMAVPPILRGTGRGAQRLGSILEGVGAPEVTRNITPEAGPYRAPRVSSEVPYRAPANLDELGFPKQGPGTSIEWPEETGIGRQVTNAEGSTVAAPTPEVQPGDIKFANLAKMPAGDLKTLNDFMGGGLLPEEAAGIREGIQEPPAPHLTPRPGPGMTAEPVVTDTFGSPIEAPEALNLGNLEDYPSAGGSLESILGGLGEQEAGPAAPLPFYKSGQRPLASPMSKEDFGRAGLPLPEGADVSSVRGLRDTFGSLRGSPLNQEVRQWLKTYIRDQASRANAVPLDELAP